MQLHQRRSRLFTFLSITQLSYNEISQFSHFPLLFHLSQTLVLLSLKTKMFWTTMAILAIYLIQQKVRPYLSFTSPLFSVRNSSAEFSTFPFNERRRDGSNLEYDFYRDTCPQAEDIVRSAMARIYFGQRDVSPALLRLFFHDCFVEGCDASVLLDDNGGAKNHSAEKKAIPNTTLRGFDKIELIKEELEQSCPGIVSCADILALATRDGIVLAGGPFYPVLTGRRDSDESFYKEATNQIPRPDDKITHILELFALKGFNARETVSLLGGHSIASIGCNFIRPRLYNFRGTGRPDPSIPTGFLSQLRLNCLDIDMFNNGSANNLSGDIIMIKNDIKNKLSEFIILSDPWMEYLKPLSSSVSYGATFSSHYYRSLLKGRGLLFSDQQLMAHLKTAQWVLAYASDDGSTFHMDFARVMFKLSNLDVLTGLQGGVRTNCSLPMSVH